MKLIPSAPTATYAVIIITLLLYLAYCRLLTHRRHIKFAAIVEKAVDKDKGDAYIKALAELERAAHPQWPTLRGRRDAQPPVAVEPPTPMPAEPKHRRRVGLPG